MNDMTIFRDQSFRTLVRPGETRFVIGGPQGPAGTGATFSQRVVTAAGDVSVDADDDDIIIIKKTVGAATAVNLPSAEDRTKPIRIVDGKGDAATNNITIAPVSGESIFASADYNYVIDSNGASIVLTPLADGTGWI